MAPFAGNNMLVLYSCPANTSSEYFVRVLHNEHPIPMPVSLFPYIDVSPPSPATFIAGLVSNLY